MDNIAALLFHIYWLEHLEWHLALHRKTIFIYLFVMCVCVFLWILERIFECLKLPFSKLLYSSIIFTLFYDLPKSKSVIPKQFNHNVNLWNSHVYIFLMYGMYHMLYVELLRTKKSCKIKYVSTHFHIGFNSKNTAITSL